ncbi:Cys-tRNA(Pro) deacylase [Clostridium celatum]|uniref:Cys-tRNA(Pro) deacylase n=2 Tax=Clostridium celatum TaxID=36834 RepID=UPI00189AB99F|nr:Cys-tRNA(Pro) deacylase [Clostridium celatum]MDY3360575.1 Cys-tRNA(Pro) deacylase [Clostridium celatum]
MKMAVQKTNAMRILDKNKIDYEVITYDISDDKIDGVSVAEKTGQDVKEVYKTLVTQGLSKEFYVFVIPVAEELDLKKAAKVAGEKKVEMIHVKDITKYTGYIRGGCSPVGMKKLYKTFIHEDAKALEKICVSGGKKGLQIKLEPKDLIESINGQFADIIH